MTLSYDAQSRPSRRHLADLFERGNSLAKEGKHGDAATCFDEAIRARKPDCRDLLERGLSLASSGMHDKALECFDDALLLKSDLSKMFREQGYLSHRLGMYGYAVKFHSKARRIMDGDPEILCGRGFSMIGLQRYGEATRCFDEAIRLSRSYAEAFNGNGVAHLRLGDYDLAMQYFDAAIMEDPGLVDAYYNKGGLLDALGRHLAAAYAFDDVIRARPDSHEALLRKGISLHNAGLHGEAAKCLDEAIRIRPDSPEALCGRGDLSRRLGKYDEAIGFYGRAIKIRPDHPDAASKRDALLGKKAGPPRRLLLPLLALRHAGRFRNGARLQTAVFMAQADLGAEDYAFGSHGFGPYSDELALDMSYNPELAVEEVCLDGMSEYYRAYSLTDKGKTKLQELEGLAGGSGSAAACVGRYVDLPADQLLDEAYSRFSADPAAAHTKDEAIRNLKEIRDRIGRRGYATWYHAVAASAAEHIMAALSHLDNAAGRSQKNAILNISGMAATGCRRVADLLKPPITSPALRPAIAELDERARLLSGYCDARGIMADPYGMPLEKRFSGDEGKRLAKAMSQIELPA